MHKHVPHVYMFLKARLKPGTTHDKKEKETFGETALETALELTESKIWALDLRNKVSGPHINKSVGPKLNLPSLLSSSFGGEGEGQAFVSTEACWIQQGSVSSTSC